MKKLNIGLIIAALAVSSCADDFEPGSSSKYMDKIGYAINIANENDEFQSRGESSQNRVTVEKLDATIGDNDLYLHTVVSDSIPQAITARKHGKALSRGSISYSNTLDEINVSAVVINDTEIWPKQGVSAQMYMNNETVTREYNWTTGRYWPKEHDYVRFYAYAPINALDDASEDGYVGLPIIESQEPSFVYVVNDNIADQEDLLVGSAHYKGDYCASAQLDLCHALTAVEIHISKDIADFTLNRLTISGLKNKGTYTYCYSQGGDGDSVTQTHDAGVWEDVVATETDGAEYVLFENESGIILDGTAEKDINMSDSNMVLMMMPQTLSEDATITVVGHDEVMNRDVTLVAKIGGVDSNGNQKKWGKGEHVVYNLSFSSTNIQYTINVIANNKDNIPYYGIKDQTYTVQSYKTVTRSGLDPLIVPVPWTAVAIENGNEVAIPAGLILSGTSGSGVDLSVDNLNESFKFTLLPYLSSTNSKSHNNIVTGTSQLYARLGTKDVPYDLSTLNNYSTSATPYNTANCYLVFAPGYYTFPLVYGNAITNGATNSSSYNGYSGSYTQSLKTTDYKGNVDGDSINVPCQGLGTFLDHNDAGITGPWIVNTNSRGGKYAPATAEIVWQDEPYLVTEVKLNDNKDYIQFRVHEETVCDGNAVIAVKDSNGTIMWSWHIWVNDGLAYHNQSNAIGGYTEFQQLYVDENLRHYDIVNLTNRCVTSPNWRDCHYYETNPTNTYTGYDFKLSRVLLGHCDGETKNYQARDITIRFKQVEDANAEFKGVEKSCDITFSQKSGSVSTVNNIPYYQYGRKDPMLPTGEKNADKIYYTNDGQRKEVIEYVESQATIGQAIKNPQIFYADNNRSASNGLMDVNWCKNGTYMNLWNSNSWSVPAFAYHSEFNNENRYKFHAWFNELKAKGVTKTVYDPCPVGFELPRVDAFTGGTYHGMNLYPLWYYSGDKSNFVFGSSQTLTDDSHAIHIYGNIWINPDGNPYSVACENFNMISIYGSPMTSVGTRGNNDLPYGGETLAIEYMGHRKQGKVGQYGMYASALTAAPVCTQNMVSSSVTMESYAHYMLSRLCIMKSKDLWKGTNAYIPYSVRVFSGSDFDLAFGIIPAKSGANPYSATTTVDKGGIEWTEGNKSDQTVDF
ncbi:MAG: fimbrillin family protein [Muribaculaceae bacterium]|nr:fimbrillin family protein [Muribaculaceae bacterium]